MEEQSKYDIIKSLADHNGNKKTAALKLGCSTRHVNRLIKGYRDQGKAYFVHGNRGRQPKRKVSEEQKRQIVTLYKEKYYDATYAHFSQLLKKFEGICVSKTTVRNILLQESILSPKCTRKTRKTVKAKLKHELEGTKGKRASDELKAKIVAVEDAHPRRPRCAYFGEMIQMDGSKHQWYGDKKTTIHVAIDDSTGTVVGAYFDDEETLKGYYNVFEQILTGYGIPYQFLTDGRTVFEYKKKESSLLEEDTYTQFAYACKQLGVDIKTSHIPQVKGRVERLIDTLQTRLPIELRLAGATNTEQANEFLKSYLKEFNDEFALPINHSKSVFETQPTKEVINHTLAVITPRKIDNGHCVKFNHKHYLPTNDLGQGMHFHKGTKAMVIKAFDGNLYTTINSSVYHLDEVKVREETSKNFDYVKPIEKPVSRVTPPMSHPWKASSFMKHVKKQPHVRPEIIMSFEEMMYSQEIIY